MTDTATLISAADAIVSLGKLVGDGKLLTELAKVRDETIAEQAKLKDLRDRVTALTNERRGFEQERDSTQARLTADRDALDAERAELEHEKARHLERIKQFDGQRSEFDVKLAEFQKMKSLFATGAAA
jgi:chromosome segregation ATPase